MNKTFAIYLLFFGLITCTYVYADDVLVKVGGPNGENIFDPQTAYAKVGDKIIFKWISGAHNVIESNLTGTCIKSSKPNAFASNDSNRNNYHDSKQINKSENQDTEKVYNPGQEAVSISENTKVYNHGQETIPISENDALQNYIVQIECLS
uniref:Uncharacterized protein n=1 Tax=Rhizophagus irregularis (strain DAOM 181602 / DAOM 197198 / MUCL 43194) TaxID=747089 RepID=U9TZR3_RHIID